MSEFVSASATDLSRLESLIGSPDAAVRLVAVREAADACDPDLLPVIERALHDAEAEVRLEAVSALDVLGDAQCVPPLIGALHDQDPDVRREAAKALAELKDPAGAAPLLKAVEATADPWILAALLEALKPLRSVDALPAATARLDHADPQVRTAAVGVLGYLQSAQGVGPLIALSAHDTAAAVRHAALRGLVHGEAAQVAPAALAALRDAEWIIRAEAAAILGKLRHAEAAPVLTGLLDFEPQWQVREQAVEALGLLRHKPAVPAIGRSLASPVSNLRKAAVIALGRIGDHSVRLLLASVREDPDAQVRKLAGQLLTELETGS